MADSRQGPTQTHSVLAGAGPVGLFGGTFNPVHRGHIEPTLEVRDRLELQGIHFVPVNVPSHRVEPGVSAVMRMDMLMLALDSLDDASLIADDREIRREGSSYTIDTLEELRALYGPLRSIVLILGLDAFLALETWKRWDELLDFAHIAVMQRPGSQLPESLPAWWRDAATDDVHDIRSQPCGCVIYLDIDELDISSTRIRGALSAGSTTQDWLDSTVLEYIEEIGLYGAAGNKLSDTKMNNSTPTLAPDRADYAEALRELVVEAMDDAKAQEISPLDVQGMTDFTDYMVIATGTSDRHLRAVAENVRSHLREAGVEVLGSEGDDTGDWVLIDLGAVVAHVMRAEARQFYDLDGLWSDEVRELIAAQRDDGGDA